VQPQSRRVTAIPSRNSSKSGLVCSTCGVLPNAARLFPQIVRLVEVRLALGVALRMWLASTGLASG